MKESWIKFKEWWASLALREKQAISIGVSLLALFILYQWIWTPYLDNVATMRGRIASDQKTLLWMQSADKIIQKVENKSTPKNKTVSSVEFLSQMQKQIKHAKLDQSLTQLKQSTNDAIEMHFQKVEFDKLIKLIATIIKNNHVVISQMTVNALETSGYVNADIVIKQS
jgi:general secretion pathway protein M